MKVKSSMQLVMVAVVAGLLLSDTAFAANILYVFRQDQTFAGQGFVDVLTAGGHTVTVSTNDYTDLAGGNAAERLSGEFIREPHDATLGRLAFFLPVVTCSILALGMVHDRRVVTPYEVPTHTELVRRDVRSPLCCWSYLFLCLHLDISI